MLEARLKSIILLWYSSHFTDEFLRVYPLKCLSLIIRIFFPNSLTTYLIFQKSAFSRASIGTRASTGTFTLLFSYYKKACESGFQYCFFTGFYKVVSLTKHIARFWLSHRAKIVSTSNLKMLT